MAGAFDRIPNGNLAPSIDDFLADATPQEAPSIDDFLADAMPTAAAPAPEPEPELPAKRSILDRLRTAFANPVGATPDVGDPMGTGAAEAAGDGTPPPPPPPRELTLLERAPKNYNPVTDGEWLSKAPQTQQGVLDRAARKPQSLQETPWSEQVVSDAARALDNPVYRGAAATFGKLGKAGIGAARFVADVLGADETAAELGAASRLGDNMGAEATRGLVGNEKLIADVVTSIGVSAPAMVLGFGGGAEAGKLAMRELWAQTALDEYNTGRDSGFGVAASATRGGIMGMAEVLGERFDFAPQIELLRKAIVGKSAHEVAVLAAETIGKNLSGEQVTNLLAFMADKAGPAAQNPNATLADYLESAGETFKLSLAQSAVMAGGPAALSKVRDTGRRAELRDTQGAAALDRLDAMRAAAAGAPQTPANPTAADYEQLARGKGFLAAAATPPAPPVVRAENMPKRPLTPEEVTTLRDAAAADRAAAAAVAPTPEAELETRARAPGESVPTPAPVQQPTVPSAPAPAPAPASPAADSQAGAPLGVAAVPQGQLATQADELLRQRAAENVTPAAPAPAPVGATAPAPAVSSRDGQTAGTTAADGGTVAAAPGSSGRDAGSLPPDGRARDGAAGLDEPGHGAAVNPPRSAAPAQAPRRAVVISPRQRTAALRSFNVRAQADALAVGEEPPQIEAVDESKLDGEQLDLTRELSGWLGRPVVVTRAVKGESPADGVYVNGTVLIDEGTREAPIAVVMHEAGIHGLDRDLKQRVIDAVRPTLKNRARFKRDYRYGDNEGIDEEMTAVLSTQEAKKPEFWNALREKLGDGDFSQLVDRILASLDRFLQGFLPDESHKWTTDIRAVRAALVDAQAEQMRRVRDRAAPAARASAPAPAPRAQRASREQPQQSRRQQSPDDYNEDVMSVDRLMGDDDYDYNADASLDDEPIPTAEATELEADDAGDWTGGGLSEAEMESQDEEAMLQAELAESQSEPAPPRRSSGGVDAALMAELRSDGFAVTGVDAGIGMPAGSYGPLRPAADFDAVTDEEIARRGVMAEEAYPELTYTTYEDEHDGPGLEAVVRIGGRDYGDVRIPGPDGWSGPKVDRDALVAGRGEREYTGNPSGPRGLSDRGKRQWNRRMMAAADLMRRNFDLYTSVPKPARKRVADLWKRIAELPGATEFRRPTAVTKEMAREGHAAVVQRLADEMFAGSRFNVRVSTAENYSGDKSVEVKISDGRGWQTGTIEYKVVNGRPRLVMHTHEFKRATSAGKPFYQLAFNFADLLDLEVVADSTLLGVNNYRRTEQQFSAAARSGKASNVKPGVGQRVYGYNERVSTAEQSDRNLVRLALAGARNAAEIVPEVRGWRYDVKADRFTDTRGRDVEEQVREALAGTDARELSFSRSTLARAALTFEAIEGEVAQLDGLDRVTQPVLYSRRQRAEDQPLAPRLAGRAVTIPVHVQETGQTAQLRVDGGAHLARLESRRDTLKRLAECLG